jgi:hypothetical protein
MSCRCWAPVSIGANVTRPTTDRSEESWRKWVIVDVEEKHNRVRCVPLPPQAKNAPPLSHERIIVNSILNGPMALRE